MKLFCFIAKNLSYVSYLIDNISSKTSIISTFKTALYYGLFTNYIKFKASDWLPISFFTQIIISAQKGNHQTRNFL